MTMAQFLRLLCVYLCIYHVTSLPGLWREKVVKFKNKLNVADMGFNPIHTHKLIFGIKACKDVRLMFPEYQDLSKGFVFVDFAKVIDGQVSTYFLVSSQCNGLDCSSTDIIRHELDCNKKLIFWLDWESPGIMKLGKGLLFGANQLLKTNYGTEFNLNGLIMFPADPNGATLYLLFDDAPTFLAPGLVDHRNVKVNETDETGVKIFHVNVVDPEEDDVILEVVGEHSDVFDISQNFLINLVPLDYEKKDSYIVTIRASDESHVVDRKLLVRLNDVIDEIPHVATEHVEIPEELPVGAVILGGFAIEDKDKLDYLKLGLEGRDADYFKIHSRRSLIVKRRIDYESGLKSFTDLRLTAEDSAGLSTSEPLFISVVDINEITPAFFDDLFFATIEENSTAGVRTLLKDHAILIGCTDCSVGMQL